MTLWEWWCAVDGFVEANGDRQDTPEPMSAEMAQELGIEGF